MHKGQIFSLDVLFAIVILIFGVGLLIGAAEINFYNYRQALEYKELVQKTITGAQVIANSEKWDCNFSNFHSAYSINKDKFQTTTIKEIKTKTNLTDYNIRISIGDEMIYSDLLSTTNLVVIDLNILACNNFANFSMLKKCMDLGEICNNEDQNIEKTILRVEAGK